MRKNRMFKRKRTSIVKQFFLGFLIGVGLIAVACAVLYFYYFGGLKTVGIAQDAAQLGISTQFEKEYGGRNITNIALFGVDSRDDDHSGRSDAIMILSVDNEHNKLKLTSIARDTYIAIPGREEKTKINHAYAYGGAELAVKTLNTAFDLNIRDYITVNFEELASIIDAVGGVDIQLDDDEQQAANGLLDPSEWISRTGKVCLTGNQAVAYSRIRYNVGGDDARTNRQRDVLSAMFEKVKSMNAVQYPAFIKKFIPMTETSLSFSDIMGFTPIMLKSPTMEQTAFPNAKSDAWSGIKEDDVWYYVYDLDKAAAMIHTFIYDDINPDAQ